MSKEKTTNVKGTVIATNEKLWCFELDGGRRIYMPHLAASNESAFLPDVGSYVKVKRAYYEPVSEYQFRNIPKVYYLRATSHLECQSIPKNPRKNHCRLLKLIKERGFSESDFKELLRQIKNVFSDVWEKEDIEDFALKVYDISGRNSVDFKTISRCKYVNSKIERGSLVLQWSFGCHPSKKNEILVGYFSVFEKYGLLMLSDKHYKMVCVVKRADSNSLSKFIDKYVLVSNYVIFTEMHSDYDKGIDYLYCDVSNLKVIDVELETKVAGFENNTPKTNQTRVMLLKKSAPILTVENEPSFLLEVQALSSNETETFYLSLQGTQLHYYQFLQVGCIYRLSHNRPLEATSNIELKRLSPNSVCYKLDGNVLFELESKEFEEGVLTVENALEAVKISEGLVSFQCAIEEKDFCRSLSSRTKRNVDVLAYGTPGTKTHFLKLKTDGNDSLILYLNNWESIQMPFGLLPNMRILVRNVLPQKRKYYKSTLLTSFEVLGYESRLMFETANLCTDIGRKDDWGNAFSLGCGYLIPNGVLVCSRITTLKIRSLRLFHAPGDEKLQVVMTLRVSDVGGKAVVICKSLQVLRVVLNTPESQWGTFCKIFQYTDFKYDRFAKTQGTLDSASTLNMYVNLMNEVGYADLELLCRKLDSKFEDNDCLPLWLCIDARKQ